MTAQSFLSPPNIIEQPITINITPNNVINSSPR